MRRRSVRIVLGVVALLVVAAVVVPLVVPAEKWKQLAFEQLKQRLAAEGQVCCWRGQAPSVAVGLAVQRQRTAEPIIAALRQLVAEQWRLAETPDSAEA